jgi:phage tail-like protein
MPEIQYPGVYVVELSSSPRSIQGVSTSTSDVIGTDVIARLQRLVEQVPLNWTDNNQSDPGIALLELLAWLAEALAFRAQQAPERGTLAAARLAAASLALAHNGRQPEGSVLKRVRCFEGPILEDGDPNADERQSDSGDCLRVVRRASRPDPYTAFNFQVSLDGIVVAGFQEVDGLSPDSETSTPIDRAVARLRKLIGLRKYATVTLKRGYVGDRTLSAWYSEVRTGRIARRTIVIKQTVAGRRRSWCIANAWPKKFEASDLSGEANDVVIESMELVHEGIELDLS